MSDWTAKGAFALADQALFSGANLVTTVLLARWMEPHAFGAFAVGLAIILLIAGPHTALVLEPMSVLGPARYADRLGPYVRTQVGVHALVTLACGLPLVAAGVGILAIAPGRPLGEALVGAGATAPFVLLVWLARRAQYLRQRPDVAAIGSALYLVATIGGLVALRSRVGVAVAFGVVGGASLLTSLILLTAIGAMRGGLATRAVWAEQWQFGRWQAGASLLSMAGAQAHTYLVAALVGFAAAGTLRAMETAMLPMAQAVTAMAMLALPVLSAAFGRGDLDGMRRKAGAMMWILTALAVAYAGALTLLHRPLERLLYGGKFAEHAWLMPVLGLIPVFAALGSGPSLMLRAGQQPRHYLVAAAIAAPVSLATALVLGSLWGLVGIVASAVITSAVSAVLTYVLCRRWVPRPA